MTRKKQWKKEDATRDLFFRKNAEQPKPKPKPLPPPCRPFLRAAVRQSRELQQDRVVPRQSGGGNAAVTVQQVSLRRGHVHKQQLLLWTTPRRSCVLRAQCTDICVKKGGDCTETNDCCATFDGRPAGCFQNPANYTKCGAYSISFPRMKISICAVCVY